jgi:hypothetical protein
MIQKQQNMHTNRPAVRNLLFCKGYGVSVS